ncbi:hypothetical protein [Sutcliffiella halmapala]|uniref:hypothetical protein n=1 Tax=Sutcliffiella halmapala TaxID=79882 RepID=UPI0009950985|nr:hypothetical protein [Sutcliffiella halmapala]
MHDLTVMEWLQAKALSESDIDFLLTFIPSISVIKTKPNLKEPVFRMLQEQFPEYIIDSDANHLKFATINSAIQRNIKNKINTEELLKRMSAQGLCRPFCDLLVTTVRTAEK